MPRNAYQKLTQEVTVAAQQGVTDYWVAILGSHEYRRFSIQLSFAGAGAAELQGALSGAVSRGDEAEIADPSYLPVMSGGSKMLTNAGTGIHTLELETHMDGGLVLALTAVDADVTISVQMSANQFAHGVSKGA